MRRTWFTFLTLIVITIAPAAFAQLDLGIDGGLVEFGSDLVDDTGSRVSLRAAWNFNDYFAVEGQVSQAEADAFDTELRTYTVNGIASFRPGMVVQPYAMAGLGFAETEQRTIEGFKVDDDGQAIVGAFGVESFLNDARNLGFRLEAGFVWEDTFGENTTHVTWSAGFIYRLDFR